MEFQPATLSHYSRAHSIRAVAVCVFTAAVSAMVVLSDRPGLYSMVLVLLVLAAAPAWIDWNRGKLDYFEPVHVIGLIYFAYFGLGAIWTLQDPKRVAYDRYIEPYLEQSLLYCVLGYVALLVGYYGLRGFSPGKTRAPELPRGLVFMALTGSLGLVGYIAAGAWDVAFWSRVSLPVIIGSMAQFAPLFVFTWALGWLLYFGRRDTLPQRRLLLFAWSPAVLAIGFMNFSNKTLAMTLIGVPVIALWYARRKVAWRALLVLMLILLFVVFPLYNAYRWSNPRFSRAERFSSTMEFIQDWDSSRYLEFSVGGFKRRMALINSVAVVVRDAGRHVPFVKGETIFLPTLAFFVPRAVWPDKPQTNLGREFGRRFKVTNSRTADTYIAATLPGELYWNFGLPGIVIGMALFGAAARFFYRRYGATPGLDPVQRATYILLLSRMARLESAIAPTIVAIVRTLVMIELLRWLGRRAQVLDRE